VAELPQWLKKQQAHRDVGAAPAREAAGGQLLIRSVSESPEIDSPKFVADEPPSRQKGGDTIAARRNPRRCSCGFPLLEHARKTGVNKYQKRKGGWIMKAKSFLLNVVGVATGLTFLSLPAGAECWMTCPPGSTTTQSAAGTQGVTATVEPTASPGLTTAKKPEATAKVSPTPVPAKPKAAPSPAGATAPAEELTTAKKPEATAKASPTPVPKATLAPDRAGPATEPPPIPPAAPAPVPAPTKGQATPPVPVPQSSETNAAFQPAPSQAAPPAPVPIPGPVPGTATMHVITE
jgi:hypothetical protein